MSTNSSKGKNVESPKPHSITAEQLRTAKLLVEKAVKMRKIFSIQGPYPVVRAGLRARGWIERRLPRINQCLLKQHREEEDDGNDGADSDDYDNENEEETEKGEDPEDIHALMSRMVRNEMTYFYWTIKRDSIDNSCLRKEQMTNHYGKSGTFTTKVGLCVNLRNLRWFDAADPDTFFPRCYRLGAEDEREAFIEDFRRTACFSLLQCIVERNHKETVEGGETTFSHQSQTKLKKECKQKSLPVVSFRVIDSALKVCQDYLDTFEHSDIDVALDSKPTLTDQQWSEFIGNYYLAVHNGAEINDSVQYVDSCQVMLQRLRKVCPQLDIDGIHNIWIIKPGAMSRGRGILCSKRLEEILKLVDADYTQISESKWVVQKYIERPLLIHETKFDVRQWFLVTDWNPLTVWFYKKCYLRFSSQPFSVDKLDSSVHLCNNSIQKHFRPSEQRHPEIPKDNMWSCRQFDTFLSRQGNGDQWASVVIPEMKKAIIRAMQTAQDLVESRRGSFEMYGADFILGKDLHPWLIEINASPTMAPSTNITANLCAAVQEDILRVVLDRKLDRTAPTGEFELIYKQPAVEVPQYVGANLLIEGSCIKRPRPPLYKPRILSEPCSFHSELATSRNCSFSKTKPLAKKSKPQSKHLMKTVIRQLTFSGVKPVSEHSIHLADSWKLQRTRTETDTSKLLPPLTAPVSKKLRPGQDRLVVHSVPLLSLAIVSFQEPEKKSTMLDPLPHVGIRFSRHHQFRTVHSSICSKNGS